MPDFSDPSRRIEWGGDVFYVADNGQLEYIWVDEEQETEQNWYSWQQIVLDEYIPEMQRINSQLQEMDFTQQRFSVAKALEEMLRITRVTFYVPVWNLERYADEYLNPSGAAQTSLEYSRTHIGDTP